MTTLLIRLAEVIVNRFPVSSSRAHWAISTGRPFLGVVFVFAAWLRSLVR